MNVLITGACGFIGRALIEELQQEHTLRLYDRVQPEDATMFVPGSDKRAAVPMKTAWPFVLGEVTDPEAMQQAVQGIDAVVHLAAMPYGQPEHGVKTFYTNADGTFIVLDEARKAGVKRVFLASSINAFGTFYWRISGKPVAYTQLPLDESFAVVPEDPYSLSKLVGEQTCAAFSRAYGLTTAAFRFAALCTGEQYETMRANSLPSTRAWSDDLYQWVHVLDVVRGIRQALEAVELPLHGVYTLSGADTRCPEPTMEILERFQPHLAESLSVPLIGRAPLLSIDHARNTFGYNPRFRLA